MKRQPPCEGPMNELVRTADQLALTEFLSMSGP